MVLLLLANEMVSVIWMFRVSTNFIAVSLLYVESLMIKCIPLFVARPILKRLLTLIGAITACCDTIEVHTGFSNIDGTYNKELTLSGGRAYYSFIHLQHGTAYLYWYIPTASWLVSTVYIYKIIRIMYMVGW